MISSTSASNSPRNSRDVINRILQHLHKSLDDVDGNSRLPVGPIGDSSMGKTIIINRFFHDSFVTNRPTPPGSVQEGDREAGGKDGRRVEERA
jgi:hypothetical protein